jgi:hypothetical protein
VNSRKDQSRAGYRERHRSYIFEDGQFAAAGISFAEHAEDDAEDAVGVLFAQQRINEVRDDEGACKARALSSKTYSGDRTSVPDWKREQRSKAEAPTSSMTSAFSLESHMTDCSRSRRCFRALQKPEQHDE